MRADVNSLIYAISSVQYQPRTAADLTQSAQKQVIQSVFGESDLAVCLSHSHTQLFSLSLVKKAHGESLSLRAIQFKANSFIDMTNVTSASQEHIWTSYVPLGKRLEYNDTDIRL